MSTTTFKPLVPDDFKLSEDELTAIVKGAQKFLPPEEVDTPPETETS